MAPTVADVDKHGDGTMRTRGVDRLGELPGMMPTLHAGPGVVNADPRRAHEISGRAPDQRGVTSPDHTGVSR